jgi:hypothetical protein
MFACMQKTQSKSDKILEILISHLGVNTSMETSIENSIDNSFDVTQPSLTRDNEHTILFTQ